ncbi:MAG: DUF5615 family PIN-like protein [Chloroflexota bacterium]
MKLLADMGISPRVVDDLRKNGHDAIHLHELGLERLPDREVLEKARAESRILLTHDLDFGELLAAGGSVLPGVIIFRLKDMRAPNVIRHLLGVIRQQSPALSTGTVCGVTERQVRVRALPI